MIGKSPKTLTYHPQKNLLPKFTFLSFIGFSDSDISKLCTARPSFLSRSLKNHIEPHYNLLRDLFQPKDGKLIAISRRAWVVDRDFHANLFPNMQILRDAGVPKSKMLCALTYWPSNLIAPTEHFKKTVDEVVEMGLDPLKISFMLALHVITSMTKSNWEKKMQTYEKWGWSRAQILLAFGTNPWCMMVSEEKIDRVMDFLVNKMGFETSIVSKESTLISLSVEKRIIPRGLVYKYCLDNGLMKDKNHRGFGVWLKCSENLFIKKLERYEKEDPGVMKFYQDKLDNAN